MNPIVLAACDEKYYNHYRQFFRLSLKKINQPYHIHICEDNPWDDVCYYACSRYLILPEMIEEHGGVFVSDIDAIFIRPIPFPDTKIGYVRTQPKEHRSEWEQRGMNLLAGMFYCSDVDIANKIKQRILDLPKRWFTDQIAIWEVVKDEPSFTEFKRPPPAPNQLTDKDFLFTPRGGGPHNSKEYKRQQLNQWKRFLNLYK